MVAKKFVSRKSMKKHKKSDEVKAWNAAQDGRVQAFVDDGIAEDILKFGQLMAPVLKLLRKNDAAYPQGSKLYRDYTLAIGDMAEFIDSHQTRQAMASIAYAGAAKEMVETRWHESHLPNFGAAMCLDPETKLLGGEENKADLTKISRIHVGLRPTPNPRRPDPQDKLARLQQLLAEWADFIVLDENQPATTLYRRWPS